MGTAVIGLWLSRTLVSRAGRRLGENGAEPARLLVFGMSRRVLKLLATFQRAPHLRVKLAGIAADEVPADLGPRLELAEALGLVEQGRVDLVLVEAETLERGLVQDILTAADREGISVHITSAMFPSTNLVPTWERVDGVPLLGFVTAELPLGARAVKRGFDLVVASVLLAVLALPLALIALLVRLSSPGPALFVQERVGTHGRVFPMVKFRTMRPNAEAVSGPVFAVADDPRCTRLGTLLRRTNLDELPQLFNVLLGHMSLVGPRPERPEFIRNFKERIPRYAHKHWVKPGITGWAQIHGLRGAGTSLQERIDHDLYYIENWSLLLDIRILVRTVFYGYLNAT
jgi:exopolysaccharide biosynthesis polyprenyl glycosylphosphotransferase